MDNGDYRDRHPDDVYVDIPSEVIGPTYIPEPCPADGIIGDDFNKFTLCSQCEQRQFCRSEYDLIIKDDDDDDENTG